MKTVGTWRYVLLAVTLLWIMPQIAEAGRIDIWPYEFGQPSDWPLSSGESENTFFAMGQDLSVFLAPMTARCLHQSNCQLERQ